jgi:hypothetical protein
MRDGVEKGDDLYMMYKAQRYTTLLHRHRPAYKTFHLVPLPSLRALL